MAPRFRDRDSERFAKGEHVRKFEGVPDRAASKALDHLDAATRLIDLRTPPSNHFEALQGDRKGQYSIRINRQWRVCFEWSDEAQEPFNIEIVDYHH